MNRTICWFCLSSCLVLALPARSAELPGACGPEKSDFKVEVAAASVGPAAPGAGMAQIIFLETVDAQGPFVDTNAGARIGIDGAWVGAANGDSQVVSNVTPGEHHVCANWPGGDDPFWKRTALSRFNAEPGRTYYFRVEIDQKQYFMGSALHSTDHTLRLEAVDSDEGKYLASFLPIASSSLKKK